MAASSNTRSGGNNKDIQKAKDKAEIKRILKPGKLDKAHDIGRGIILGTGGYMAAINTYKFGKTVLHGSPQKGLKTIKPTTGSKDAPDSKVAWAFNPKAKGSELQPSVAKSYAGDSGSIYVAKVPRSSIKKVDSGTKILGRAGRKEPIVVSGKPLKVVKEIQLKGKNTQEVVKEVNNALKKSGSRKLKAPELSKIKTKTRSTDF